MLNPNKFAFIICTNNEIYLQECLHYISLLEVPEGYSYDVLTLQGAASMTAGYNEGMTSCDAKYKIYMHQDVFIFNRYFLSDILSIFASDSQIGMIGMVGYPQISSTGFMWQCGQRMGAEPPYGSAKHAYPDSDYTRYRYHSSGSPASTSADNGKFSDAALIDGMMMVTAYDLTWDEENLKAWHFYDAFQCMNFLLNGYRIVVPKQSLPWCLHDDGKYLNMFGYDEYRKLFMEKYKHYLGKSHDEIRKK